MKFISYAQNFEDLMLWRALKGVEFGFYIDLGAAWPDQDTVTKAFYERGWRGINVEPNPMFCEELKHKRTEDTNLCVAVGEKPNQLPMFFLDNPGLSTLDKSIADSHFKAGISGYTHSVKIITLEEIWRNYVPEGQNVHFLKVDIEGAEEAALRGNNWETNRPWVIVIEATMPLSQVESHTLWETILLEARYNLAYSDGLNRFYVANERSQILDSFRYPPNIFDDYVLSSSVYAEERALKAEERALKAEERARYIEECLHNLISSKTWRMTSTLRSLYRATKSFNLNSILNLLRSSK